MRSIQRLWGTNLLNYNKKTKNKTELVDEIRRVIRASIGNRAKESLVVDFINETNLDATQDKASIIDSFFAYAQSKQKLEASELITDESLNEEAAKRYITAFLKREYASENGTEPERAGNPNKMITETKRLRCRRTLLRYSYYKKNLK